MQERKKRKKRERNRRNKKERKKKQMKEAEGWSSCCRERSRKRRTVLLTW